MSILKRAQLTVVVLLSMSCLSAAQAPSSASDPIPVERTITIGKLPNGIQYYVRSNPKPEKRAELRLVVKAGSVLEDDDQRGLAHMVEHMSFNGTLHFPGQNIVGFLQALGMRFGAHINAHTGFDETVEIAPTDVFSHWRLMNED